MSEAELIAIEDAYDGYVAWAAAQDVKSTYGLNVAYGGLNDLGLTASGSLGGKPW